MPPSGHWKVKNTGLLICCHVQHHKTLFNTTEHKYAESNGLQKWDKIITLICKHFAENCGMIAEYQINNIADSPLLVKYGKRMLSHAAAKAKYWHY